MTFFDKPSTTITANGPSFAARGGGDIDTSPLPLRGLGVKRFGVVERPRSDMIDMLGDAKHSNYGRIVNNFKQSGGGALRGFGDMTTLGRVARAIHRSRLDILLGNSGNQCN